MKQKKGRKVKAKATGLKKCGDLFKIDLLPADLTAARVIKFLKDVNKKYTSEAVFESIAKNFDGRGLAYVYSCEFLLVTWAQLGLRKAEKSLSKERALKIDDMDKWLPYEGLALQTITRYLQDEFGAEGIITTDQQTWQQLYELKGLADKGVFPDILLLGETGVGKELFARHIHALYCQARGKPLKEVPFEAVNCAALPAELVESELFGYEKGAFTGAEKAKPGKFENANRGTLFLDEIGNLPLSAQEKVLRVIERKESTRIGGSKPKKLDLRLIYATNKNLWEMVDEGSFLEDLFYRIFIYPIEIKPLRRRPKRDFYYLTILFRQKFIERYKLEKKVFVLPPAIIEKLATYSWPGNVREFENVLTRLLLKSLIWGKMVDPAMLAEVLLESKRGKVVKRPRPPSLREAVAGYEKACIEKALVLTPNQKEAARLLAIAESTLTSKMRKLGIKFE